MDDKLLRLSLFDAVFSIYFLPYYYNMQLQYDTHISWLEAKPILRVKQRHSESLVWLNCSQGIVHIRNMLSPPGGRFCMQVETFNAVLFIPILFLPSSTALYR